MGADGARGILVGWLKTTGPLPEEAWVGFTHSAGIGPL
jgi:hypothetical protein